MSTDISRAARPWLESVLARFGIPDSQRQDCIAGASVTLGDVDIVFLQPPYSESSHLVARAVVGEVPPEGQCEPFYKLVLEVQAMLCGPHSPVLGLDWPARTLLVSCTLDMPHLSPDDAAEILVSMRKMALQWREAIAQTSTVPASRAPQAVAVG